MKRIVGYRYLKERIKHVVRFRHKRGYGVHSPFMFNLIVHVIREKNGRCDYPEWTGEQMKLPGRERKLYRLLFRLVRFWDGKQILCLGNRAASVAAYLKNAVKESVVVCNLPGEWGQSDFIYVGHDACNMLSVDLVISSLESAKRRKCIIITDIYRSNAPLWRLLGSRANVRINMMWYGILLFDDKLQPGKYNLTI